MDNKKDQPKKPLNQALRLTGAGAQMGVTIWLCAELGGYLDDKYFLGTSWCLLVLTLLGIAVSIYHLINQVNKLNN